ncbi:hypothetical protein Btru_069762 [Bulinus truncatus]|nr:hypothetical protein Btru_069762 [Bulinus truncatus]
MLGVKVTVVSHNKGILCADILRKFSEAIGLKKESLQHFILCQGLEKPVKCFKKDDFIPSDHCDLSLQKWCFDLSEEKNLTHKDPVATNLIFLQAQHEINTGKLKPSKEEAERLSDCLDPDFPADGQYLRLCQRLPGYNSVLIPSCCVLESPVEAPSMFPCLSELDVVLSVFGLCFSVEQNTFKFTWCDLIKWRVHSEKKSIIFMFKECDSDTLAVPLLSEQTEFLFSAMLQMLRIFQNYEKDSDMTFHTDMIETLEDGSVDWTNVFYNPHKSSAYINKL